MLSPTKYYVVMLEVRDLLLAESFVGAGFYGSFILFEITRLSPSELSLCTRGITDGKLPVFLIVFYD
jgi:hypothetical protein